VNNDLCVPKRHGQSTTSYYYWSCRAEFCRHHTWRVLIVNGAWRLVDQKWFFSPIHNKRAAMTWHKPTAADASLETTVASPPVVEDWHFSWKLQFNGTVFGRKQLIQLSFSSPSKNHHHKQMAAFAREATQLQEKKNIGIEKEEMNVSFQEWRTVAPNSLQHWMETRGRGSEMAMCVMLHKIIQSHNILTCSRVERMIRQSNTVICPWEGIFDSIFENESPFRYTRLLLRRQITDDLAWKGRESPNANSFWRAKDTGEWKARSRSSRTCHGVRLLLARYRTWLLPTKEHYWCKQKWLLDVYKREPLKPKLYSNNKEDEVKVPHSFALVNVWSSFWGTSL